MRKPLAMARKVTGLPHVMASAVHAKHERIRRTGRIAGVMGRVFLCAHFAACCLSVPHAADVRADIEFLASTTNLLWHLTRREAEEMTESLRKEMLAEMDHRLTPNRGA